MSAVFRRLLRDRAGSAIIEFGILAPAILTLLIGIIQIGMWMQSYNALRTVAADTGRYVAIEYQKSNRINNAAMALWARQHAIDDMLFIEANINTDVTDAPNQTIAGVTEKTLTINYTMPSFLGVAGIADLPVSFSRPIFVKTTV